LSVTGQDLRNFGMDNLLDSVATVLNRAGNFVWRGMHTTVRLLDTLYERGGQTLRQRER